MQISRQQAEKIFRSIRGTAFVGITTCTTPTLKGGKSNPQQGKVEKKSESSVFCGEAPKYKNMLKKKAADIFRQINVDLTKAEINVTPMQIAALWNGQGEHVGGAIVRHKGKGTKYIQVYFPKNARPKTSYTMDGEAIDKRDIQGLKQSKASQRAVAINGEAVTVEIVTRCYKLENVISFRHNGEKYQIVEEIETGQTVEPAETVEPIVADEVNQQERNEEQA